MWTEATAAPTTRAAPSSTVNPPPASRPIASSAIGPPDSPCPSRTHLPIISDRATPIVTDGAAPVLAPRRWGGPSRGRTLPPGVSEGSDYHGPAQGRHRRSTQRRQVVAVQLDRRPA